MFAIRAFDNRGNINLDTFLVEAEDVYLLQRLNTEVFTRPDRVMRSMVAWLGAQREAIDVRGMKDHWTPIELVPTHEGRLWHVTEEGEWWRLMRLIQGCVSYKSLSEAGDRETQLALAEEIGRGLALNADLTADLLPEHIETALPGYRNTELYMRQFDAVAAGCLSVFDAVAFLPDDADLRTCTESLFHLHTDAETARARREYPDARRLIELVRTHGEWALSLYRAVHEGKIRRTAIHGDTKIENFLFHAETGKVRSLVDLDTIMPYTWLADWGDMLRSLCNVAGEKERDLDKIQVDEEIYAAVARGFLSTAGACPPEEIELMADAVPIIAFELGVRFLTDYLRGDNYFMFGDNDPADLNLVRAQVQLTLFTRLLDRLPWAQSLIRSLSEIPATA